MIQNSLSNQTKKPKFSVVLQQDAIQKLINNTLVDPKKAQRFITSISSAVAINPTLQECESYSIINAALLGETLNLSPSPQLGHYYMVPFNDKNRGKVATFQLGYKGYIQLAIRSGQYKSINVIDVKQGELIGYDRLSETIELSFIDDEEEREKAETIGYCAMFETVTGFRKMLYWTKKRMMSHALKYSPGFKAQKGYTFWEKDFDGMAFKTMLRQLISKWGIMSIELQSAFEGDMSFKDESGNASYVEESEDTEVYNKVVNDVEVTESIEQQIDQVQEQFATQSPQEEQQVTLL